ncbi:hypothetical protein TURU_081871 [Turdus rufiventris]|nr:hypothetical protein TURU_081871 [Turdus rufiventris]
MTEEKNRGRKCEKNNYADAKVSEEGGGGGAPGAGVEILLQAMVKITVKQAVLLQPMEGHRDAEIHLQPVEEPYAGAGGYLEETVSPWEIYGEKSPAPMLEQPVLEGLHRLEE